MSKRAKKLKKMESATDLIPLDQVEAQLKHHFGDRFEKSSVGGSHQLRISHPDLFGKPEFVGGTLSIPVKGGQWVKPHYQKRIALAIKYIEEAEAERKRKEAADNDKSSK